MHILLKLTKKEAFRKGLGLSVGSLLFLFIVVFIFDIFPVLVNASEHSFDVTVFLLRMSLVVTLFAVVLFINYKRSKKDFRYCKEHDKIVRSTNWKEVQQLEERINAKLEIAKAHVVS